MNPEPPADDALADIEFLHDVVEMNEALVLGAVRQHELTETAERKAERLQGELADRAQTARELTEKARLLDLASDAIIVRDIEGRISYWNHGAEMLYGWSREEALGKTSHALLQTESATPMEQIAEELERNGHWTGELVQSKHDGQRITVLVRKSLDRDSQGNPASVLQSITDITERKRAETALRESEERFRAAVSMVSNLVWTNNAQGMMVGEQPGWGNFTGQTPEEYQGYGWAKAVHPEDAQATIAAWELNVAKKSLFEFEHRVRRHDGEWRLCSIHAVPLFGADGAIREWVGVHTDITERQRAEAALRGAKEAAETANQSKDRFLAVLSHELRTPLTPVLMAVAALEHDSDLRPDVREDMVMIKRNIELETKLIDDLLDVSRIANGKLPLEIQEVDLNEAVRHVCGICRPSLRERGIRLETALADTAGSVAADPARLQQVLWNVLKNAIKFTPDEGTIRLSTQRLDGTRCEVRVQDSGMGISDSVLPRIFDAFEQGGADVTRQFGGLGLGLAICTALAESHGGSIRAESAGPGHGATFVIELPVETPAACAKPARPAPLENGTAPPLRLLLVEDHADTARTISRLLRAAGYAVVAAADVASAIAAAQREPFDLLISDLGLPDGDGYEIMRAIRAERPVPGIAMSGYGMGKDVRRSLEAGFTEHLVKPIAMPQLLAAIGRVTDHGG